MTLKEIANSVSHRPWEMPNGSWKFYQEWNRALFLHWEVELSELEKLVPKELEIDLFQGKPWVSVVAFTMENIRPKYAPSFSPISNFNEINIRTYVKHEGKAGVYFLSIEGGKSLSCKIAKAISELPYRYSKIKRSPEHYFSLNKKYQDQLSIDFSVGSELKNKTLLDHWLTERYALFQDTNTHINTFEIHHLEWNIKNVTLHNLECKYLRFDSLIRDTPHQVHYSEGVQVLAWGKRKKKR